MTKYVIFLAKFLLAHLWLKVIYLRFLVAVGAVIINGSLI